MSKTDEFARVVKVKAIGFAEPQYYFDVGIGNQRMNFCDTEMVAQQRADYINAAHSKSIAQAVAKEREACAKVAVICGCMHHEVDFEDEDCSGCCAERCAERIRSRA